MTSISATQPQVMTLEEYQTRQLSQEDNIRLWSASMESALMLDKDSDYSLDTLMQSNTQESLDKLTAALETFQMSQQQGTDYLDRTVSIPVESLELKNSRDALAFHWQTEPGEDVIFKVLDKDGEEISKISVTTNENGLGEFIWEGEDGIEPGNYSFEATINGQPLTVNVSDKVTGVFPQQDGSFYLELKDLGVIDQDLINRITV